MGIEEGGFLVGGGGRSSWWGYDTTVSAQGADPAPKGVPLAHFFHHPSLRPTSVGRTELVNMGQGRAVETGVGRMSNIVSVQGADPAS